MKHEAVYRPCSDAQPSAMLTAGDVDGRNVEVAVSQSCRLSTATQRHTHCLIRPRRRPVCPAEEHFTVQRTFQAVDSVSCELGLPRWDRRSGLGSRATPGGLAGPMRAGSRASRACSADQSARRAAVTSAAAMPTAAAIGLRQRRRRG